MRDIKFRIWADNTFYYKCLVGNTNDIEDNNWTCPIIWLEDRKEWVHCDNGIISQYTGLKDKNGVEIYEGDIVKIKSSSFLMIGKVIFNKNNACFEVYDEENSCNEVLWYLQNEFEVLGNIYENKELLGG